ncbi:MAG: energy-coupling factor transporter ATPase [Clostridia bacterium]|nr:energy-coupling factor transporter ATPase [Clostridia bacterium]
MMIRIENLSYVYQPGMPGEYRALSDINLVIPNGSLTAVIGHTGSGKSTLMQQLNGLLQPTSGKIFIDDEDITSKSADIAKIRRKVGLVFQYPEHQLFEETVYQDIAFGPKNMGLSDEEIERRVIYAASLTGIDKKYFEKSPFELSGGQKRRAAIAGILAMEPSVLVMDEPTAGLDPGGRDDILNIIKNLHKKQKEMIIIFVSHSMEEVAETAENIVVMHDGRIDMSGTAADIFRKRGRLLQIGLDIPQITKLADKLRNGGYNLPEEIYTVKAAVEAITKLSRSLPLQAEDII